MVQIPFLGVLLVFHVNQVFQPLFSTNFPTALFFSNLSLYFQLNSFFLELRFHLPFELPWIHQLDPKTSGFLSSADMDLGVPI